MSQKALFFFLLLMLTAEQSGCKGSITFDTGSDSGQDGGSDSGGDSDSDSDTGRDVDFSWTRFTGREFDMGSESGSEDEKPIHAVTVEPFELMKSEATVAQYGYCVEDGLCGKPERGGDCNWDMVDSEKLPINCISWRQAVNFCKWAGGRLPTESEWEYAARSAGKAITYPWGNEEPTCDHAVMFGDRVDCGQEDTTMNVCSKPAGNTVQGLCDMAGNVWEWIQDWYHPYYTGAPIDGSAWEIPVGSSRVLRGGAWTYGDFAETFRVANREEQLPGLPSGFIGVRCARSSI